MFSFIRSSLAIHLAIDLGTTSTLIYEEGHGLIVNEPTIVALTKHHGNVVSVGHKALEMLGRAPRDIVHVHPLKDGAIADFNATEKMLKALIGRAVRGRAWRPFHVTIAVPNQSTAVERRAVRESVRKARASQVNMIEEGIAVGWGCGIPVHDPQAGMVIDIGGGTTNITVIASSGIVCSRTISIAGKDFDRALMNYIKRERELIISELSAEELKTKLGSVMPLSEETTHQVIGKGVYDGVPRAITVTSDEIRPTLVDVMSQIANEVLGVLDYITAQTLADIYQRGIIITGGSALIKNLDKYLEEQLQIRVFAAEEPIFSVVHGISKIGTNNRLLERVKLKEQAIDWRASEALIVGAPY